MVASMMAHQERDACNARRFRQSPAFRNAIRDGFFDQQPDTVAKAIESDRDVR
jgi:hypothetical protein